MITIQDLYNILGNKISNEMQKAIIRKNCPSQIAEWMCAAIDGQEKVEHFQRLLHEYNEPTEAARIGAAVLEGILYVGELWYIQALL